MVKRKIVKEDRGFKGVWIPAKYWLDENLTSMEMLMLVEIDSLDQSQGCFASNKHFADFFGLTTQRCSQLIKSLESKGYLQIDYEKEGKQIKRRVIKVSNKFDTPSNKFDEASNKFTRGIKYSLEGYQENVKGSNTSRVIQDSNTEEGSKAGQSPATPSPVNEEEKIPYKKILDYLNEKTGKDYRNVPTNQDLIRARWNNGYRFDDFIKVIDNMVAEWKGTGVTFPSGQLAEKYLRPTTLFSQKFDKYLNEKPSVNKTDAWSKQLVNLKDEWKPISSDELPF